MAYLLDTNACIQILRDRNSPESLGMLTILKQEIYLCTVVYSELYYGAFKSSQIERNLIRLEGLFEEFTVLPFDQSAARVAGQIRASLTTAGIPIGSNDLLIGAVAVTHNLTLITHNTREFRRIDSLQIEDWKYELSYDKLRVSVSEML